MNFLGYIGLIPILIAPSFAIDSPPCLIIEHATASQQIWVSGANWRYVAGDFPKGMKWKSNITDRNIRKIKESGGRIVVLPTPRSPSDLEDARTQCAHAK